MNSFETSLINKSTALLAVMDHSLHCVHLSLGWRRRLGLSESDAVDELKAHHLFEKTDSKNLNEKLESVLRRGESVSGLRVRVACHGDPIRCQLTAWLVHAEDDQPGVVVMVEDVEELSRTVDNLSALEERYQLILDAAGEGIYGLDHNGRITFGNSASTRIIGWHPDEVLGEFAHDVHHHSHEDGSHYPREQCPIYAAIHDGEIHRVDDEVFWHTDGTPIPVEYTSTPIMKNGTPDGAVVVFRDISERRKAEREKKEAFEHIRRLTDQLEQERDYLRDELSVTVNFGEIIGESPALKRTLSQIEAVAKTPVTVLIFGESGVGKEMIARAIHNKSERSDGPMVKVNCASIPNELFESEFFGHVRGAFTGAHKDRIGRLKLADSGTLFLDEVGEIPLAMQGKLLRALQEHEFERVGDDKTQKVDVRIVAATNKNLSAEVAAGRFREDLFYRLSVFPVEVPPLRDRMEDIAPLALHFIEHICKDLGRDIPRISKGQLVILQQHDWPGNIRELNNVMERAVILTTGSRLRLDLALQISVPTSASVTTSTSASERRESISASDARDSTSGELEEFLTEDEFRETEKANMIAVLSHTDGQVWGPDGAASLMGIKPSTFSYRMNVLGIEKW